MKIVRYALVTLVLLIFSLLLPTAEAVEITNINDQVVKDLQNKFASAKSPDEQRLAKNNWNCQLYGMRSRLQSTKKDNFYKFSFAKSNVKNSGSQIIKEYQRTEVGLSGKTGPLFEVVRSTEDGRLIGEMSIAKNGEAPQVPIKTAKIESLAKSGNEVIAYSVCN